MKELSGRSALSEYVLLSMDKKVELLNEWIFFDNNNMLRKSVWRAKKHATWRKNAFRSGRESVA